MLGYGISEKMLIILYFLFPNFSLTTLMNLRDNPTKFQEFSLLLSKVGIFTAFFQVCLE